MARIGLATGVLVLLVVAGCGETKRQPATGALTTVSSAPTTIPTTLAATNPSDAESVLGLRPDWTDDQISNAAADMSDNAMAKLDPLDERFYTYPDPIEERLLAFIRAHSAQIRL